MTKVILIGGAAGTGKTTIANKLSLRLGIKQVIGLGFTREAIRAFVSKSRYPQLFSYTFRTNKNSLIKHFNSQSLAIRKAVKKIIYRAITEGTDIIIEGSQIIPQYYSDKKSNLIIILYIKDKKKHKKMLTGNTHRHRRITNTDFTNIRLIQEEITRQAKRKKVVLIENRTIKKTVNKIVQLTRGK